MCALRKKCPHSEFFWFVFSHIRTEYREILRISPYSIRMLENTDQKDSEYGHFSCSGGLALMNNLPQTSQEPLEVLNEILLSLS